MTLIGRPYSGEYFALCRDLAAGKQVAFVTDADDDEVAARLRAAQVAVLPSVYQTVYGDRTALPELLGFAALEAMASGTPTICTRVGGLPEVVVDGDSGLLVPPNDPLALRQAIASVLDDAGLAARLGTAGRRRAETVFSWDVVTQRCLAAYASALTAKSGYAT